MIDDLITREFRHLLGPIRNVAEIQFDDTPACLADNMVVVIFQLTKLISDTRTFDDFKDHAQGFKEFKRSIDRGQPDFFPFLEKALIDFQRTPRA
jgi:hypothetical protein